jgi:ABC-type uncharacterized transport system ATPase subunit
MKPAPILTMSNSNSTPMLEVQAITKKFGELVANDSVSLKVSKGEIHALLGENGAGKSTLVKMLYGSLQPDGGKIIWHGDTVEIKSPSQARSTGIGMVFQHFSLFDSLSVAENIALSLGKENDIRDIGEKARQVSQDYGLPLQPDTIIGDMSVGERQRVEIVRCLLQNPELIILDEPTSVLTPQEADSLFETLERLRAEGRSILYISHRLDEVQKMCDHATILRHGKVVGECTPADETAASLANLMVGEDVGDVTRSEKGPDTGEVLLELNNVNQPAATPFAMELKNINLKVKAGEVVGVAGVAGNGQSEFFDILSGETTSNDNSCVRYNDKDCGSLGITGRRMLGGAFVAEERLGHSAVPDLSLSENLVLARHGSDADLFLSMGAVGVINNKTVKSTTKRICEEMDVRKSGEDPDASALSGGNLQKFIMGRELDREPSILIVNQPTWGVDAGAAQKIRQAVIDLARSGSAVVVISQDLDEIMEISDRIAVMSDGHLSEPENADAITREDIGLKMGGLHDG